MCTSQLMWRPVNNFQESVLPSHGFWGSNLVHETRWQAPLSAEPSYWPNMTKCYYPSDLNILLFL